MENKVTIEQAINKFVELHPQTLYSDRKRIGNCYYKRYTPSVLLTKDLLQIITDKCKSSSDFEMLLKNNVLFQKLVSKWIREYVAGGFSAIKFKIDFLTQKEKQAQAKIDRINKSKQAAAKRKKALEEKAKANKIKKIKEQEELLALRMEERKKLREKNKLKALKRRELLEKLGLTKEHEKVLKELL